MPHITALPEALEHAAAHRGGYVFRSEDGRTRPRSYAEILGDALRIAGALDERGLVPGDRVALIVPDPEAFLLSFLGASVGGFVPVPIYPPLDRRRLDVYLHRAKHIVSASGATTIVTEPNIRRVLGTLWDAAPELRHVITRQELDGPPLPSVRHPRASDPAFIQFTSGSTSAPKGVVLSHANIYANVQALGGADGIGATSDDVGVSWLPLFHDMGLIGMAIGSIYHEVTTVLMSPLSFLRHPIEWLRAISEHRGTISFAPNFAYSYCARRIKEADMTGIDLSSWRIAGCGAEPIDAGVLQAFAARFAPHGFSPTALLPCYGIAEHTLAVTFPPPNRPLRVDTVRASHLALERTAAPCGSGETDAVDFVGCGRAFPGHAVAIVDDEGRGLPERRVGEIVLSGPSVMTGYERDAGMTREALRNGWLHTGDLGYVADGDLFVCGREKDVIVVNGRNYFPQDVEWAVGDLPGVRRGGVVAFGTNAFQGREHVIVVAETNGTVDDLELTNAIRRRVAERAGLPVHDVVLAPSGTIPKTSSGKVQRAQARVLYERGELLARGGGTLGLVGQLVASEWGHLKTALRGKIGPDRENGASHTGSADGGASQDAHASGRPSGDGTSGRGAA